MQKVILDTNVIVSALIQKSFPHYIVFDYVLDGQVQLCLSEALLDEYHDVLLRPKFARINNFESNAEIVLNRFAKTAVFYEPQIRLDIIKDKSDNKLLELADECKADFLITGNSVDFVFSYYKGTKILSPHSFWDYIGRT
ncbi:MAG: putative toxin-antitoxin system toxin component, PIN family [Bacteroidetes bacterium]|nr:putative toxin-antitoxin system toxin component, PIN family [Bacteroidota bacterium]